MLQTLFNRSRRASSKLHGCAVPRRRLTIEPLEDRCLLSLLPTATALIAPTVAPTYGQAITLTAEVTTTPVGSDTPTGGDVAFTNLTTNT